LHVITLSVGSADFRDPARPVDNRGQAFELNDLPALAAWLNEWAHPAADKTNAGGYWCPFGQRQAGAEPLWTVLVLDYDRTAPPPELALYDRVTYPTRSDAPAEPRSRVILSLTRPLAVEDVKRLTAHLAADRAATGNAQLFWGRHPTRGAAEYAPGLAGTLDPDTLLAALPAVSAPAEDDWTDGPEPDARPIADDAALVERMASMQSARATFGNAASFADLWTADADALARVWPAGGRADGLPYDASSADQALSNRLMWATGNDCERTARLLRASGLARPKHEREDYVRSTVLRARQSSCYGAGPPAAPGVSPVAGHAPPLTAVSAGDLHTLTFDARGRYASTISNVSHVLAGSAELRLGYDSFRGEIMLAPAGTEEWRPLDDVAITRLLKSFEQQNFAPIAVDTMRRAIDDVSHNHEFDSAILWLDSLRWDGTQRIDRFLPEYGACDDSEYARAVGAYLWTALAGRVLDPGCKADMVPVFIGPQGTARKTSTVEALVPSPEHFVDLDLYTRDADLARLMRGRLVAELSELRGLAKRDLESLKSFITRSSDDWRPIYKEFYVSYQRRLVFIGTTNHQEFLQDDTGNRRWLPVEVRQFNRERVIADREQLWAEGAVRFRESGIAWQAAERLAPTVHGKHMISDSWDALVGQWLETPPGPNIGGPRTPPCERQFTMRDVLEGALKLTPQQMNRAAEQRAARVLRGLGYESFRARENGSRFRVWQAI
jgi:hypothetical protein